MTDQPLITCVPTASRRAAYDFYRALGFGTAGEPDEDGIPEPLQVVVNERASIMLVPTVGFGWIAAGRETAAPGTSGCVLSLAVEDEEAVRALLERARAAGAEVVTEAGEQPWGYAGAFADLDGHLWMARAGRHPW